jgi:hypothetical protein
MAILPPYKEFSSNSAKSRPRGGAILFFYFFDIIVYFLGKECGMVGKTGRSF